jgi:hypothetical protein
VFSDKLVRQWAFMGLFKKTSKNKNITFYLPPIKFNAANVINSIANVRKSLKHFSRGGIRTHGIVFQKRFNMLMAAVVYYPGDLGN